MTREELQEQLNFGLPEQARSLRMVSGRAIPIPHIDYVAMPRGTHYVVVSLPLGSVTVLDPIHIEGVDYPETKAQ
jgi:hypothetical protein